MTGPSHHERNSLIRSQFSDGSKASAVHDDSDPGSCASYAFSTKAGNNRYVQLTQKGQDSSIAHKGAIYLKLVIEEP